MKKVKKFNFNEDGFIALSTLNAIEIESLSPVRLWILRDLYYFNPKKYENSGNKSFSMQLV